MYTHLGARVFLFVQPLAISDQTIMFETTCLLFVVTNADAEAEKRASQAKSYQSSAE
jgi:hypothetical protein